MDGLKREMRFLKHYRLRMAGLMLFADLLGFSLTTALVLILNQCLHVFVFGIADLKYGSIVLLCLVLFMSSRLYPGMGLSPPEEMRLVTQFISIGILIGLLAMNIVQPGWRLNYFALLPTWGISLVFVLFSRWGVRILSVRLGVWGEPVVVFSHKDNIERLTRYFSERQRLGFLPVLGVGKLKNKSSSQIDLLDVDAYNRLPDEYFAQMDIQTALVGTRILADLSELKIHQDLLRKFRRLIFVSDMDWLEGASISLHDFEGMLGMEVEKKLLSAWDMLLKRVMDVLFSAVLGLVTLPLMALVMLAIRLDSPGPIFYSQERLGKRGRGIRILKFRTMVLNADHILEEYLQKEPALHLEWEQTQKLKDDPRITRVGKWLRKFSIDELPQIFNVFKGDMSLVGPRPIVEAETHHYGEDISVYTSMHPGLTGLWQVSGRNLTSYQERVRFDTYYVRNWSTWLDLYILLRTAWTVLNRHGAY